MDKTQTDRPFGPLLRVSLFGAFFMPILGLAMCALTCVITFGLIKLMKDNDPVTIKQVAISLVVFLVFVGTSILFVKLGIRAFMSYFRLGKYR